jgi:hypothetical protein
MATRSLCWHVYKKSVLVIGGKNNKNDGMFTGNNYREPNLGKLRRDNAELHADSAVLHAKRKCVPGLRVTISKAQER